MSIEELKKQRAQMHRGERKSQVPYAILLLASVVIGYYLFLRNCSFGYVIFYGILVGYILQRSKFCFTASIRDFILFQKTKVLRAVLLGMLIATIGFGVKQYQVMCIGEVIPGQIATVGMHTVIGGFLFGIGMVIAGGCVSGTFTRIGEGYLLQWITLLGMFLGTAIGVATFKTWSKWFIVDAPRIYFGDYIPLPILIVLQVMGLLALIIWFYRIEKNKHK